MKLKGGGGERRNKKIGKESGFLVISQKLMHCSVEISTVA